MAQSPATDSNGFMRYRVLESKGNHYKVEYQENGGERSRQLRPSSSTLKSGTFSVTTSQ